MWGMSIDALDKDSNTNCTTPDVKPDNTPATGTSDEQNADNERKSGTTLDRQNADNNRESVDGLDGQHGARDHKWANAINLVPTGVEDAGHGYEPGMAAKSPVRIHLEPALLPQPRAH